MRASITIIFAAMAIGFIHLVSAEIIINEIRYNPPETTNDNAEYIELYNLNLVLSNLHGLVQQLASKKKGRGRKLKKSMANKLKLSLKF